MSLIGINASVSQKKDALDKISAGINIANGLLGTILKVPEFLQSKKQASLNAFESNQQIQLNQNKISDAQPATPQDIALATQTTNGSISPDTLQGISKGELSSITKSFAIDSARNKEDQKNNLLASSQPITEQTKTQKGWTQRSYPEFGITDPRMFPDPVALRADTQAQHEQDQTHKQYEDDYKIVREAAKPAIAGGRGAAQLNLLGQQIMSIQRGEHVLDQIDNGTIKDNKVAAQLLGDDLTKIMTGGAGGSEDRGLLFPGDSYSTWGNVLSKITSEPQSILSPANRQQLREQFNSLRETTYKQYSDRTGANAILLSPIFENPTYGKKLEKIYWSSVNSVVPQDKQDSNPTPPSSDVIDVNGKKFKKVPGGWDEVKP